MLFPGRANTAGGRTVREFHGAHPENWRDAVIFWNPISATTSIPESAI